MIGYLLYDIKDIDRGSNRNFINWLIEKAKELGIELKLVTDISNLPTPDFILNRGRNYKLNEAFDCMHINTTEVVKIANDKWLTYLKFKDHIKMMPTYKIDDIPKYPCIIKNRFGHGGDDVHWVTKAGSFNSDYIGQDIAPVLGKDLRVYILDNKIYASVLRSSDNFKSNYSLGGHAQLYHLNNDEKEIIQTILDIMPIDYGGIDFLFDQDGKLILNEIEDPVGAKMLYNLTDLDLVEDYLHMVKRKIIK